MFAELGVPGSVLKISILMLEPGEKQYIGGVAEKYGVTIDLFEAKNAYL
jgi:hypothetical protein